MQSDGSSRVTLAQVAARAGVSVMTASYTYSRPDRVSQQARARVLTAAAELGYAGPDPRARSLRRGSTLTLGVVLGERLSYAFEDPGAVAFLAGVADVCAERGYGMTILPITGADGDVARVTDAAVDGFVVWTTSDDDPVLTAVRTTKQPAVIHGGPRLDGLRLVSIDNHAAARAIGAVAFAGARRPAVVSQPLSRDRVSGISGGAEIAGVTFPVTRDRLAGYREAAAAAGIGWNEVQVAVCGRNDVHEAELLATRLLGSAEPPDAIAAMSDQQAAGVIRAAGAVGCRIPDDLALTGWDDVPAAAGLGLTTVAQSLREQGLACARAALGEEPDDFAEAWSVVRRSTTR
jgi:DNA-binding LacI/PurR family transcriptional regulator